MLRLLPGNEPETLGPQELRCRQDNRFNPTVSEKEKQDQTDRYNTVLGPSPSQSQGNNNHAESGTTH